MNIVITWIFRSLVVYTLFDLIRTKKRVTVLERTVKGIVDILKKITRSFGWIVKKVTGQ